jgi:zinc transporter ZupT
VLGLSIGEIKNEAYLTAFVAGNFIYIGAIDMFPELIGSTNLKETIL